MNKKGFTLIELLAVIVILAIIIVIAVPSVINIQSNLKMKSANNAALLFYKSVDTCIQAEADYTKCSTGDNTVLNNYYEGTLDNNEVKVSKNGKVTLFKFLDPASNNGVMLSNLSITKNDISETKTVDKSTYDKTYIIDKGQLADINNYTENHGSSVVYKYQYITGLKNNKTYKLNVERLNGTTQRSVCANFLISKSTFTPSGTNYGIISHCTSDIKNLYDYTIDSTGKLTFAILSRYDSESSYVVTQEELIQILENTNLFLEEQ